MEGFCVVGGERLEGEAAVPSAKNAMLPMLAAAILPQGDVTLRQCPDIRDVRAMAGIPEKLGCRCEMRAGDMRIHNQGLQNWEMPEELSHQIRSSIFLLGPILAKLRRATVSYPGGCEIGLRPIDLHLKGLRALVLAALCAQGETVVEHAGLIDRGYPRLEAALAGPGRPDSQDLNSTASGGTECHSHCPLIFLPLAPCGRNN